MSGVIICTLKLKYVDSDEVRVNFFKLSMAFAACNLLVSALLLVSVLKVKLYTFLICFLTHIFPQNKHKCAFLYACLSFLSLFAATLHIEGHTTRNATFLITFSVFGEFIDFIYNVKHN